MSRVFGAVCQNGYIVRDIRAAMDHWINVMGVGPWYYIDRVKTDYFRHRGEDSAVEMSIALLVGVLWFQIPFVGSPLLLFGLAGIFLLTTLGMGLFFSTITSTQQQAMFFAWFFSVFAILTSGFFTPVGNMPQWLQYITYINPMRFFMNIVRGIMMKGAGLVELLPDVYTLLIFGAVIFGFSALRFTKRTG